MLARRRACQLLGSPAPSSVAACCLAPVAGGSGALFARGEERRARPSSGPPAARRYTGRAQLWGHLDKLQALANTAEPARARHRFQRRSKIVCTIGPKVANPDDIRMLMAAGMNVARLNFSHGEYSWFERTIEIIREVKAEKGRDDVAIALDTKGPEIRTGQLKDGSPAGQPGFCLNILAGQQLLFTSDPDLASAGDLSTVYIDYPDIGETVVAGGKIMLDDGLLEFTVEEAGNGWVRAIAMNSGQLGERKGVNLPGAEVSLPAVSEKVPPPHPSLLHTHSSAILVQADCF